MLIYKNQINMSVTENVTDIIFATKLSLSTTKISEYGGGHNNYALRIK